MEVISKPQSIRGLGNVCNLKTVDDFVCNHSSIESEVTSDGTVYCMSNISNPVVWFYTLPSEIKQGVTCNLTFGLKNSSESVLTGKSVKVYVDDTLVATKTTGVGGTFTYTLDTTGFGLRRLRLEFNGDEDYNANVLSLDLLVLRKVIAHCNSYSWCSCRSADTNEPIENVAFYSNGDFYGYTNSGGIFPGYSISEHPYRCKFVKDEHWFEVIYDD